jgi:N-acetylmuramoyl-L-alanine amidase CwlA
MWHKLKDIFGYNDSRNKQSETVDNKADKKSEQSASKLSNDQSEISVQKENLSSTEPVNATLNETVSQSYNEQLTSLVTNVQEKLHKYERLHHECYECKVTASFMSLFIASVIGTSLFRLKKDLHPKKHMFVYIANLALFGSE